MAGKVTKIGSKTFATKKELQDYLQGVLYSVRKGDPLTGITLKVVDTVFRNHPNHEDKTQGQSYKIAARTSSGPLKQYREFYIIREDGTETDFSYKTALAGKTCKITHIKHALRCIVQQQQWDAKTEYFEKHQDNKGYVVCPVTNLKVKYKESHVDHYPIKFETIVANWFNENGMSSANFEIEDGGDNAICMVVSDKVLERSFYNYHEKHAKYRIVLAKANLQAPQGKREVF